MKKSNEVLRWSYCAPDSRGTSAKCCQLLNSDTRSCFDLAITAICWFARIGDGCRCCHIFVFQRRQVLCSGHAVGVEIWSFSNRENTPATALSHMILDRRVIDCSVVPNCCMICLASWTATTLLTMHGDQCTYQCHGDFPT